MPSLRSAAGRLPVAGRARVEALALQVAAQQAEIDELRRRVEAADAELRSVRDAARALVAATAEALAASGADGPHPGDAHG